MQKFENVVVGIRLCSPDTVGVAFDELYFERRRAVRIMDRGQRYRFASQQAAATAEAEAGRELADRTKELMLLRCTAQELVCASKACVRALHDEDEDDDDDDD